MEKFNEIFNAINENLPMIEGFPKWELTLVKDNGTNFFVIENPRIGAFALKHIVEVKNNKIVDRVEFYEMVRSNAQTKEEVLEIEEMEEFLRSTFPKN